MIKVVMAAVILAGSVVAQAQPLCMPSFEGSQGGEPYRFVYRFIESLSIANEAANTAGDPKSMTSFPLMLLAFNQAAAGYDCAARIGSEFVGSNDDLIKRSSQFAHTLYGAQAALHRRMAEIIAKAMDARETGNITNTLAQVIVKSNEVHKDALALGGLVAHVLVDRQRVENDRLPYLRITGRERDTLIALLRRQFGPPVHERMQAGQHALVATAAMLHHWLSKEGYRPSD